MVVVGAHHFGISIPITISLLKSTRRCQLPSVVLISWATLGCTLRIRLVQQMDKSCMWMEVYSLHWLVRRCTRQVVPQTIWPLEICSVEHPALIQAQSSIPFVAISMICVSTVANFLPQTHAYLLSLSGWLHRFPSCWISASESIIISENKTQFLYQSMLPSFYFHHHSPCSSTCLQLRWSNKRLIEICAEHFSFR